MQKEKETQFILYHVLIKLFNVFVHVFKTRLWLLCSQKLLLSFFLSQSQKWGWLFVKMSTWERLNLDPMNIFISSVGPKIIQPNWPLQSKVSASIFFLHAAIHTFTSCYIFRICNSLCDFLAPTVYWWDLCLRVPTSLLTAHNSDAAHCSQ